MKKWLIALIAVAMCALFVGGIFFAPVLSQTKTQPNPNPVVGMVDSPAYASGNINIFMKVQDSNYPSGIPGESQDANHKGWIEVTSYNWTISRTTTSLFFAGNFQVVAEFSKATPILFQDSVSGTTVTVTIAVQSTDSSGHSVDICTWKLSGAVIMSYSASFGFARRHKSS